ncbi:MAG: glucosaminidase domain-containing protein [Gammaproteobacteria bacterium]|nr:glucosaminidase domain-containing protein [Gammaproteobacteria bacterium]
MLSWLKNVVRIFCCASVFVLLHGPAVAQEVVVFGSVDDVVDWMRAENWWGEEQHGDQLQVPNAIITGISDRWRANAQKMPVPQKKEIFYRFMLPLVMHANTMVLDRRARLRRMSLDLAGGRNPQVADVAWLRELAVLLRIMDEEAAAALGESPTELQDIIGQALNRLDVIPAGLVLGQAAYESGYGTSRFAAEGNALFGQWAFGGKGMVPGKQRSQLGDHRIASFEWPFDSVRAYFINLSSHPAYAELRRLRAELKAAGKPVTSLALADGLIRYSERGQAYVDTLKGIIRVNQLDIADDAVFRDEPTRYVVPAEDPADAAKLREEIEALRKSGELARIIARMQLE